jgi:hypothetical protein
VGINPQPIPGVRFQTADTMELVNKAADLEFQVFAEYGYPGKGPHIVEFAAYPCIFYVAVTQNQEVVGAVRVIVPSPNGYYTAKMTIFDEWESRIAAIQLEGRAISLPMSAIREDYRTIGGFSCLLHLYREIYRDSVRRGYRWWIAPIDVKVFPHYSGTFNFDFVRIGPDQDCLGAPSVPALLDLEEEFRHLKKADPDLFAFFRQ